ncbi:MAG: class II aldolase/adducin family protein, partial [Clostridia bacterium]|nr:class II aldolase/adducin family protein [Clostridia bacterium]
MAYKINEAKALVIDAGKELLESGLIARTWGNVSARISDTQFVITPSGKAYETLTPEDIVTVNIADCSYEGDIKPSSEKGVHAEAYRLRPDVDFIIHTHQ